MPFITVYGEQKVKRLLMCILGQIGFCPRELCVNSGHSCCPVLGVALTCGVGRTLNSELHWSARVNGLINLKAHMALGRAWQGFWQSFVYGFGFGCCVLLVPGPRVAHRFANSRG